MGRADLAQEKRIMLFEEVYGVWTERRLTQEAAAELLGGLPPDVLALVRALWGGRDWRASGLPGEPLSDSELAAAAQRNAERNGAGFKCQPSGCEIALRKAPKACLRPRQQNRTLLFVANRPKSRY